MDGWIRSCHSHSVHSTPPSAWSCGHADILALRDKLGSWSHSVMKHWHQKHELEPWKDLNPLSVKSLYSQCHGGWIKYWSIKWYLSLNYFYAHYCKSSIKSIPMKWKTLACQSIKADCQFVLDKKKWISVCWWRSSCQCFEVRVRVEETRKICGSILLSW